MRKPAFHWKKTISSGRNSRVKRLVEDPLNLRFRMRFGEEESLKDIGCCNDPDDLPIF